jgi:general secretion pathway protein C
MSFPSSLRALETLTPQQWLDRASRTVPQLLSVVLVIAIAWQLVQLTWLLLGTRQEAQSLPEPAPVAAPIAQAQGPDVDAIANAHLFGEPQAEEQSVADAPQTQMNLLLSAVFASSDPQKGIAIIGESAASANVYAVGDAVRSGTKLHAVYPDRVILDRSGKLEALALPTQSLAGIQISQAPKPGRQPPSEFQESLRRIAETNPHAFAEIIRPQPVFANGVQRGYRVYPGRNRQHFARLGLQPGDLVLAVNGTPLDDPQRGMEIFNTIGSSDRVTVTVERNGQSQDLSLNTAQVGLPDAGQNGAAPNPANRGGPIPVPSNGSEAQ